MSTIQRRLRPAPWYEAATAIFYGNHDLAVMEGMEVFEYFSKNRDLSQLYCIQLEAFINYGIGF
jgi:hypothetical protein